MGYKEKKTVGIPKRKNRIGYRGEESEGNTQRDEMFWVQRRKIGYSKEKMMPVPIEIRENGYREEKEFLIPISKGILKW